MRVLFVHNYYQHRGGEDAIFEEELKLLSEHGHPTDALTFNNATISTVLDSFKTGLESFFNPVSARLCEEKIRTFKPDVIHIHNFFPIASPSILYAADKAGVPVVMTLHNYRLLCANAILYREGHPCEECLHQPVPVSGIMHACYRKSRLQTAALAMMTTSHRMKKTWSDKVQRYIALTEFARQKFIDSSLGLSAQQVVIKPNFIADPGESPVDQRQDYILYVGRLTEDKGIGPLLKTFKELKKPLKIVGTGPLSPMAEAATRENSDIEYLGFQQRPEVLNLMRQARALIFPSVWYEGFPVTILEALATGTPVLASEIGGLPEIIRHGENGLLFSPGDVKNMTEIATNVLSDNGLHQRLCEGARQSYLQHYSPEVNLQKMLEIYQAVMDS